MMVNRYEVIQNDLLGDQMYLMKLKGEFKANMGQFYMMRSWDDYPLLSRPISIYNIDEEGISFVYKVVGKGTELLAGAVKGDMVRLDGPYGNGFERVEGKTALLGGGIGIAPLYMVSQNIEGCDAYLGFRNEPILIEEFEKYCSNVKYAVGDTFVTDIIDVDEYDNILVCGPTPMMKRVVEMTRGKDINVYVSLENRMACGVGACLVCTCKTTKGNRRTCKDGPVFRGEDVILDD